jgi:fatty acid desaturase
MSDTANATVAVDELRDPAFQRQVNRLRDVDNVTNWVYLAREYFYLAAVLGAALAFYHCHSAWGIPWPWLLPVTLAAVVLVGVGQHRLVMLAHEGSHFLLFKNLTLNEWASNWFCFYPVWSAAYGYRLQHMAHHQFTNDPDRDPDLAYMAISGHRFRHPMPRKTFLWECGVKLLLWVPGLVTNVFVRAAMTSRGGTVNPYRPTRKGSRLLGLMHLLSLLVLGGLLGVGVLTGNVWLLALPPVCLLAALLVLTPLTPDRWYMRTGVKPVIAHRWAAFQRQLYATLLLTALAWLTHTTGHPWPLYYAVLWLVPLGTVFSYLMLLREEIQHSNTPQGRFVDSRNFEGSALLSWALFPYRQNHHLPHHLFPLIPHYNLPELDRLLRTTSVYRERAVVVQGYLFSPGKPQG